MHKGDNVNTVWHCFNLRSLDVYVIVGCPCVVFVRRDDEKKQNKKQEKKNTKKHKNKYVSSAKHKVRSSVVQVTFLPASSLV